jgi:hypothetical protein
LASNTIITFVTLTLTRRAITFALIGALHIIVSRVCQRLEIRVLHLRKLFGGSIRIRETVVNNRMIRTCEDTRHIQITLKSKIKQK